MTQTRVMIDDVFKGNRQTYNSQKYNRWAYDSLYFRGGFLFKTLVFIEKKHINFFICKLNPQFDFPTSGVFLPVVLLLATNNQLSSISNQSMKT